MTEPVSIFNTLSVQYPILSEHKYTLLFIAGSLEGFTAMILAGFLLSVGKLALVPTFFVLSLAEMVNGFMWYAVGYWGGTKPIEWLMRRNVIRRKLVEWIRGNMLQYTPQAILLAKMTFSITVATQILVGSIRYPLRRFTVYNLIGSFGWVAMILAVGYFFGEGYKAFFQYLRSAGHLIAYGVLVLVLVYVLRALFRYVLLKGVLWLEHLQKLGKKLGEGIDKIGVNGSKSEGENDINK